MHSCCAPPQLLHCLPTPRSRPHPLPHLDGALGLDGGHAGVHILGHHVTAVHQAAGHVLAVAGVAPGGGGRQAWQLTQCGTGCRDVRRSATNGASAASMESRQRTVMRGGPPNATSPPRSTHCWQTQPPGSTHCGQAQPPPVPLTHLAIIEAGSKAELVISATDSCSWYAFSAEITGA